MTDEGEKRRWGEVAMKGEWGRGSGGWGGGGGAWGGEMERIKLRIFCVLFPEETRSRV